MTTTKYFLELNPQKVPDQLLNDQAMLKISSQGKLVATAYSILEEKGYFELEKNLEKVPRPLLTYPLLDYLSSLDLADSTLMELGAGHSTLFFQKIFKSVRSYETDKNWVSLLEPHLRQNVELSFVDVNQIEEAEISREKFDWLLVDFAGKRTEFLRNYLKSQNSSDLPGYIILDNSEWYRNGAALLADSGYSELPFYGLKTAQTWVACSSLFVARGKCLPKLMTPFQSTAFMRTLDNGWDR